MIALEATGEHLFGDVTSTSYDEVEWNEQPAREYLANQDMAA